MTVLVIGGSGSGKSAYAEELAVSFSREKEMVKYYLATMQVFDREGCRKVDRHRRLRSGKGFITVEQTTDIQNALERMEAGEKIVLLECISNLTANEMFSGESPKPEDEVKEKIAEGIRRLKEEAAHLIIVSNNVFEDGAAYDETVMRYIRTMGRINQELAVMAEKVVEVTAGIPIIIKRQGEE